jgi:hypothetical protein
VAETPETEWNSVFLVPGVVSMVLLLMLWRAQVLSRPGATAAWFAAGVVLQAVSPQYSPLWVCALLTNVGTAIYLTLRLKLS